MCYRQGTWKQTWPYYTKVHGQNVCVTTAKHFEERIEKSWMDVRSKRMQDSVTDEEVLTPPRGKIGEEKEEGPTGIRKEPRTKFPPTMWVGRCSRASEGTAETNKQTNEQTNHF